MVGLNNYVRTEKKVRLESPARDKILHTYFIILYPETTINLLKKHSLHFFIIIILFFFCMRDR